MAAPLNASMPDNLDLGPGWTLRVTALAVTDGSVVSAVKVSNLNVELGDGSDLGQPDVGDPILIGVSV